MKRYINLYRLFLHLNFSKLTAYRGNFVSSCVASLAWAIFSVVSILLLTSRNPAVFGWSRDELLVLTGVYSIFVGLFHVLFSRNLDQVARIAHRGQLDGYLVKPVDMQFYLSCSIVNFAGVPRVAAAVLFVAWLVFRLKLQVTLFMVVQFALYGAIGLVLLYAAWFCLVSLTIRYSQLFNLSDLLYHVTDSAKYPSEMYREFRYYVTVFLLPISFIITLPAKVLLSRASPVEVGVMMALAVIVFFLSRVIGTYMLKFYTSASS